MKALIKDGQTEGFAANKDTSGATVHEEAVPSEALRISEAKQRRHMRQEKKKESASVVTMHCQNYNRTLKA